MRAVWQLVIMIAGGGLSLAVKGLASVDPAGQDAAGMVAGIQNESGARLVYNDQTLRLEVRDDLGSLLEEIAAGSVSRTVDTAGQEFRLSFGKDELGRPSVLVRPGPAMRKPLLVEVFGRKAVISQAASLVATLDTNSRVVFEASMCGEIYIMQKYDRQYRVAVQRLEKGGVLVIEYP
jgi:hypothetical protein